MDLSINGYLSRRTREELERILAIYGHLRDDPYYKDIVAMAEDLLEKRKTDC